MELKEQFIKASNDVNTLSERPSNEILLKLYAFFKQGTEGDITGERPGGFDFKGAAKFDAWNGIKGMDKETAMQQYIDLVTSLLGK